LRKMQDNPLISCLCVTRRRVPMLRRAVRAFNEQSYPNKELVIVYEDDDIETAGFLSDLNAPDIVKLEIPSSPRKTLGALRNLAVARCGGEYFCQWDDDDYYHVDRLSFQIGVIRDTGMPACVLFQWLLFDTREDKAYLSCMRPWEGSLLCLKSLLGDDLGYEESGIGEDTPLVNRLFAENNLFPAVMPKLYIYVYHSQNVWAEKHWQSIFDAGIELSPETSRVIKEILDGKYSGKEAARILDDISG
jgi:glycosyltransferase involved in cell wall biosynthesis